MKRAPGRLRVVFDCNTFIQGVSFDAGPAAECIRLFEAGRFELFISKPVLAELRRVLNYAEVIAISPSMTPQRIGAFLDRVIYRATLVRRVPRFMTFERDPNDEPYLNLGAAIKADYLVTRDLDLLHLMEGHSPFCKRFRQKTRPLQVVNPVEFLKRLESE